LHPPKSYRSLDLFLNLLPGKVGDALGNFSHDCPLEIFESSLSYYSLDGNLVLALSPRWGEREKEEVIFGKCDK
jgi:hypothetical protein